MNAKRRPLDSPSSEELAAYLDGELQGEESLRVELWLANNPEVSEALESHADVTRRYQFDPLPEPTPQQWEATLCRIEAGLKTKPSDLAWPHQLRHQPRRRRWLRWTAAAAAVMLFALSNMQAPAPRQLSTGETFPVAEADEIEILSIHGQDTSLLVVGAIPLQEPLALVSTLDVTVENMQPDVDGMVPDMESSTEDTTPPMIVAPTNGDSAPVKTQ